jgi:hypothetical protein
VNLVGQGRVLPTPLLICLVPSWALCCGFAGVTSLHASAISIGDRTIAFVGPEGAGKSTTAAAVRHTRLPYSCGRYCRPLEFAGVLSGATRLPRLRLWPTTVAALSTMGTHRRSSLPPDWGTRRYYLDVTQGALQIRTARPATCSDLCPGRSHCRCVRALHRECDRQRCPDDSSRQYLRGQNYWDSAKRAQEFELLNSLRNRVAAATDSPAHLTGSFGETLRCDSCRTSRC